MRKIYKNPEILFVQVKGHDIVTASPDSLHVYTGDGYKEYTLDTNEGF